MNPQLYRLYTAPGAHGLFWDCSSHPQHDHHCKKPRNPEAICMTENDGGAARELMTAVLDWVPTLEGTTALVHSQGNSAQRGQLVWGHKYNCKVREQRQCRARG